MIIEPTTCEAEHSQKTLLKRTWKIRLKILHYALYGLYFGGQPSPCLLLYFRIIKSPFRIHLYVVTKRSLLFQFHLSNFNSFGTPLMSPSECLIYYRQRSTSRDFGTKGPTSFNVADMKIWCFFFKCHTFVSNETSRRFTWVCTTAYVHLHHKRQRLFYFPYEHWKLSLKLEGFLCKVPAIPVVLLFIFFRKSMTGPASQASLLDDQQLVCP